MDSKEIIISATPDNYQRIIDNYVSILEKTNNQLNVWTNPYGIMIGFLTLLVAVGAIIVAILLWKNSNDQKDRVNEFFKEQEKIIKERNERADKLAEARRKEAENKFDKLIAEQQKKLESATNKNKKEIEKAISELKKDKASIGVLETPNIPFISIEPDVFGLFSKSIICTNCGKEFKYYDDSQNFAFTGLGLYNKQIYCSHCGAINIPQ